MLRTSISYSGRSDPRAIIRSDEVQLSSLEKSERDMESVLSSVVPTELLHRCCYGEAQQLRRQYCALLVEFCGICLFAA